MSLHIRQQWTVKPAWSWPRIAPCTALHCLLWPCPSQHRAAWLFWSSASSPLSFPLHSRPCLHHPPAPAGTKRKRSQGSQAPPSPTDVSFSPGRSTAQPWSAKASGSSLHAQHSIVCWGTGSNSEGERGRERSPVWTESPSPVRSQNHRMVWVGRDLKEHLVPTPLPRAVTSSPRPGCSELHPTRPLTLPGRGHPQLLWATCSSVSPPSCWRNSS